MEQLSIIPSKEPSPPPCPRITCSLEIDGLTVGFVSQQQKERFLSNRTFLSHGKRVVIHGIRSVGGGMYKNVRGVYFEGHRITDRRLVKINMEYKTKNDEEK